MSERILTDAEMADIKKNKEKHEDTLLQLALEEFEDEFHYHAIKEEVALQIIQWLVNLEWPISSENAIYPGETDAHFFLVNKILQLMRTMEQTKAREEFVKANLQQTQRFLEGQGPRRRDLKKNAQDRTARHARVTQEYTRRNS